MKLGFDMQVCQYNTKIDSNQQTSLPKHTLLVCKTKLGLVYNQTARVPTKDIRSEYSSLSVEAWNRAFSL